MRAWTPVIIWMAVIFIVSTNLGSAQHTSLFIRPLVLWIYPGAGEQLINQVHYIVRKGGHITEYAVLALLVLRALHRRRPALKSSGSLLVTAWITCVIYAASDEFHQSFVSTRTASVGDVMIDSCGAAFALLIVFVFQNFARRRI